MIPNTNVRIRIAKLVLVKKCFNYISSVRGVIMTGVTGLSCRVVIIPQLRTYPLLLPNYKYQESLAAGTAQIHYLTVEDRNQKPSR